MKKTKTDIIADKPAKKKSRNYMDKKLVHQAFIDWKLDIDNALENDKPKPMMPNLIAVAIMNVAKNSAIRASYRNYSYREDMEAKAIVNMVAKAEKYDPTRQDANPFAFLSFITENTFREYIPYEQKQYILTKKYRLETQAIDTLLDGDINQSNTTVQTADSGNALTMELYNQEVSEVAEFDRKLEEKKRIRKERLEELKQERLLNESNDVEL